MKIIICCIAVFCSVLSASADTLVWEGSSSSSTLGEAFDGQGNTWGSTNLASLGLTVYARTDNANHVLNANNGEFGINSGQLYDVASDFDVGETMVLRFSEEITLDYLNFNSFQSGDEFVVAVQGQAIFTISYGDLDNGTTDDIALVPSIVIGKDTEVALYTSNGSVGLDYMNISVIPEPATLSLIGLFSIGTIAVRRFVKM